MTTILLNLPDGTGHGDQRFKVTSDVESLEKELRVKHSVARYVAWSVLTLVLAGFLVGIAFAWHAVATAPAGSDRPIGTLGVLLILLPIVITLFPFAGIYADREVHWHNSGRRRERDNLKRSMNVGRDLDLPVLTRDHVEAGLRLDELIKEKSLKWNRSQIEQVRSLLFADLGREDVIFSVLSDRSITSVTQLEETVLGMESSGKPLQNGWL